ncbi:MAG: hypothetical protein KC443_23675 [Anaerolineales bacterium]|nr:hypothetical protein [Anaerolineales bacterium]
MSQRLTFKCYNCQETYTLLRDTEGVSVLLVKCPYCHAEAEVDLQPYLSKAHTIYKGGGDGDDQALGQTLELPDVLPTRPRQS